MQLSTALNLPNRQVSAGGFGYGASLALDLTSGTQTLDPRITFSRTSNATVTNSDGLIAYAPHNLLLDSEQFDDAVWTKGLLSVTANTVVAPDGTLNGDKLVEDTSNGQHHVRQSVTGLSSGATLTLSVYVKAAERTTAQLYINDNTTTGNRVQADFNLSTGTTSSATNVGTFTGATSSITPVGNGWYRCVLTGVATGVTAVQGRAIIGTTSYTGDGTSGIFLWGAQLNVGALQPYYTTSVKNLLGYTQEFDNAAWTKSNSSITANTTTAPDGSLTADKLVENTANSTHTLDQTLNFVSGTTYTASTSIKPDGRPTIQLVLLGTAFTESRTWFNLTTGVATTTQGSVISASIVNQGNGWYRVSVTQAASATGSGNVSFRLWTGTTALYTGDGTSGIFIWGTQLSDSASLDPYVYNPVAAPAAAAYYGPRFDYDPVTLAPKGLLIEESRTNLLLQSEDFTTSWSVGGQNATITSNTTTAPNGTTTADTLTDDATNGIHRVSQTVTTSNTLQMVYSVFAKYSTMQFISISASTGTTTWAGAKFDIQNGVLGSTSQQGTGFTANSSSITDVGNGWYRCVLVYTPGASGSTLMLVSGATDGTTFTTGQRGSEVYTGTGSAVFLWGAQMETGAFPTSYIPTTTAAATRAADVATMIGANFSNWYNADEGTWFADFTPPTSDYLANKNLFLASDNTTSNFNGLRYVSAGSRPGLGVTAAGTTQASLATGVMVANTAYKMAGAYKINDFAVSRNGAAVITDTSGTIPTVTQAEIGTLAGINVGTQYIRRIAYFPRRLSDAELQGITS